MVCVQTVRNLLSKTNVHSNPSKAWFYTDLRNRRRWNVSHGELSPSHPGVEVQNRQTANWHKMFPGMFREQMHTCIIQIRISAVKTNAPSPDFYYFMCIFLIFYREKSSYDPPLLSLSSSRCATGSDVTSGFALRGRGRSGVHFRKSW